MNNGFELNLQLAEQMGALHLAASTGLSRMVRLLLSAGMNVDTVDPTGRTPLHWAVSSGHIGVVRILIAHRAKINVPDAQGK